VAEVIDILILNSEQLRPQGHEVFLRQTYKIKKKGVIMSLSQDFADEFFKEDSYSNGIKDDFDFLINNYIFFYNLIKLQNDLIDQEQEMAQKELIKLRKQKELLKNKGKKLSNREKIELEEKEKFLLNERNKERKFYYMKKEIEAKKLETLVIKYQKVFKYIASIDNISRIYICKILNISTSAFLWPVRKMSELTYKQTEIKSIKDSLKSFHQSLEKIPQILEDKIPIYIDLNDHIPTQRERESSECR